MNFPFKMKPPAGYPNGGGEVTIKNDYDYTNYNEQGYTIVPDGGSRRRRRSIPKSSRKYKKSSKRVFRKKSRSTRRR